MPLSPAAMRSYENIWNKEKAIDTLAQEMNLSHFDNDVPDRLKSILTREKEFSKFLSEILDQAGIIGDVSELLINKKSILNQIGARLEAAKNYEELMEKSHQLESHLELCRAELSNYQNDEL